jgi:hypothetical protein
MRGICNSSFELAHYAIALGRYYIASGREASLKDILKDIRKHPNPEYIEELKMIDEIEKKAKPKEESDE